MLVTLLFVHNLMMGPYNCLKSCLLLLFFLCFFSYILLLLLLLLVFIYLFFFVFRGAPRVAYIAKWVFLCYHHTVIHIKQFKKLPNFVSTPIIIRLIEAKITALNSGISLYIYI